MSNVRENVEARIRGLQLPAELGAAGSNLAEYREHVAQLVGHAVDQLVRHGDVPGLAALQQQVEAMCQAIEAGDLTAAFLLAQEWGALGPAASAIDLAQVLASQGTAEPAPMPPGD